MGTAVAEPATVEQLQQSAGAAQCWQRQVASTVAAATAVGSAPCALDAAADASALGASAADGPAHCC